MNEMVRRATAVAEEAALSAVQKRQQANDKVDLFLPSGGSEDETQMTVSDAVKVVDPEDKDKDGAGEKEEPDKTKSVGGKEDKDDEKDD